MNKFDKERYNQLKMFDKEYHILSLSGGKDSTALAFFIKENMPEVHEKIEYVFYDTGLDLDETYTYLNKIEVFLNKKITYVKPQKSFEDIYYVNKILPSPFRRWCTVELKVKPSQKFLEEKIKNEGEGQINLYIGIRADESFRLGAQLKSEIEKKYVKTKYPLVENGINKQDVEEILKKTGINMPEYYKWRSRNGCFMCFYQSQHDWIKLYKNAPQLFIKAMEYEKLCKQGHTLRFGLNMDLPLSEIIKPDNMKRIEEKYRILDKRMKKREEKNKTKTLYEEL